ncbi:cytoskeletal protein-binding protein SLA1 [Kluyveromyces lactis]|uniref:Actin cytoskeleton-regulatory complex protein SLA1 n=1 Tax=Kluyveromyces lactis (strain ATCC 8585 / CBS 2359 / DSM 70799 / NBRC 1267 / NRRL Y-1140 / WM37) TaxID=284590 RepID=Q6CXX0_KLULA|nr:uncharacterized protein KLLA0_A04983g [Kluyveromyces lactis]CAH02807.1 KLLA0A04983p [Kluyveromyces lactis]|eukprot:XP_451219.1 uncharacterized protein KLLA0_A04983g [Kluyveromyces lactis]
MTVFLGVYQALYDYSAQTDEELTVKEGDLLYLLEKSSIDDWWTVKKRVIGSDQDEPVGLVPKTYIEEAPVIGSVVALYDYEQVQNANEELVFHENDTFQLYDDRDADWFLVKNTKNSEVGFVPGNYVEKQSQQAGGPAAGVTQSKHQAPAVLPLSELPAPPQRLDRVNSQPSFRSGSTPAGAASTADAPGAPSTSTPPPASNAGVASHTTMPVDVSLLPPPPKRNDTATTEVQRESAVAEPPAMPQRPSNTEHQTSYRDDPRDNNRTSQITRDYSDDERDYDFDDDEEDQPPLPSRNGRPSASTAEHVWSVSEVDGRKKCKATLTVSAERIHFFSAKTKVDQEWAVKDLINYNNEKKHLFLEFKNPYINLELHTGSNDLANEIMGVLGEIKGAQTAVGLREVEAASRPAMTKKRAKAVYDFFANSPDELTVKEGDYINILDDRTSKDWYMCESVETGKRGIVPAQFVETRGSGSSRPSDESPSRSKSKTRSRSNTSNFTQNLVGSWKEDADQDVSKKKSKTSSFFSKKKKTDDKEFPDPKKVRIWVDRSGTFKVEAQFLGCVDGKVNLHKVNGVKIAVAADKLSEDDILYVERLTGMSMEKFKHKPKSSNNDSSAVNAERERRRKAKERERELEERERDRQLREQELKELKRARDLLESEREKLRSAQDKELPPVKPPRPGSEASKTHPVTKSSKNPEYDWFEFFLNAGVDVNNCQRYTINFEREQISEEILPDIEPSLLRNLGLREGDILRVMKYLDNKFGRTKEASPSTGLFTEADGSLKVNHTGAPASAGVSHNLLPDSNSSNRDDDAWTVRPAAKASDSSNKAQDFSGSLQDLLDLQPLEPKKKETPAPDVKHLESVTTNGSNKKEETPLSANKTGTSLVPLDPFKTGGNNLIPITTGGFIMMPVATGGLMPFQPTGGLVPLQRTGGMIAPQTTFGMQPTGTVLPVQKTANGLIPANTGGLMPQTTFGVQPQTAFPATTFGSSITGGAMPLQRTGGALPPTSFNTQMPGAMPLQSTNTFGNQLTGGANLLPSTTFGNQFTGGANLQPATTFGNQFTGGANIQPATTFGNQFTGGANIQPNFNSGNLFTGNQMNIQPQTTFGNQFTGGINLQNQPSLGNQLTGGALLQQSQLSFGNQLTGGANVQQPFNSNLPQTSFGLSQTTTGGFQPQSSFGINLQRTGGMNTAPQTSFNNQGGVNQVTNSFQNMNLSQQPLQNQPTGFGFGNGPQAQQQRQANIFNASSSNPFGF